MPVFVLLEARKTIIIAYIGKQWTSTFFGALRLAETVLPYMRKQKKGRVIMARGLRDLRISHLMRQQKGAIESLAKCLEIENSDYGISFHLFHPPLTDTASAEGLPIPKEFKVCAQKVGYGLAEHIWSKKSVIFHIMLQSLQMKFTCLLYTSDAADD